MAEDQVDRLLKAWGTFYRQGAHPPVPRSERTRHALAAMQVAPGRKVRRVKLAPRDGYTRRLIMGRAAGLGHAIPMAFVDPVPCKETRSSGYQPERPVPGEVQHVEATVKALERVDLLRGLCLRAHYCVEGDREEKALWVTDEFRKAKHDAARVTVNVLKNEAAFGRAWVEGRLSLAAA
jgi:hypothetical protein